MSLLDDIPSAVPYRIRGGQNRAGPVRAEGRKIVDDAGAFFPLGTSFFWALWAMLTGDEPRVRRWLEWLRDRGFDYARIFGEVGGPTWEDRTIDPRDSRYADALAAYLDLAFGEYGLRTQVTVFGGGTGADPELVTDKVLSVIGARANAVMSIETANEAFQNFANRDLLRRMTRKLRGGFAGLVATSSPPDVSGIADDLDVANFFTAHPERQPGDDNWRQVRQPWDYRDFPVPGDDNEPPGPQSSVAVLDDPLRLAMMRALGIICGMPAFVLHTGAGVRGGGAADRALGRSADIWETPNIDAIAEAVRNVDEVIPEDAPNWTRANNNWTFPLPEHPLPADSVWSDDPARIDHGIVRAYSAFGGNQFVVLPFGVRNFVLLRPRQGQHLRIYDVGERPILVRELDAPAGEDIRLEGDPGGGSSRAYIVVGVR